MGGSSQETFDVLGRYRKTYQKFVVTKIPEEKKEGKVIKKERITREFVDTSMTPLTVMGVSSTE